MTIHTNSIGKLSMLAFCWSEIRTSLLNNECVYNVERTTLDGQHIWNRSLAKFLHHKLFV